MEKDKELVLKNEHVKYEYEGYQVRVYFSSDKTLKQCIQNLAERRIGG
ncbi:TetR family transcriptional regulator [Fusicatenibacter saccharivorans]